MGLSDRTKSWASDLDRFGSWPQITPPTATHERTLRHDSDRDTLIRVRVCVNDLAWPCGCKPQTGVGGKEQARREERRLKTCLADDEADGADDERARAIRFSRSHQMMN
jgi:hypothetical protein